MKKLFSFILAIVTVLGLSVNVLAFSEDNSNTIIVQSSGHGEFHTISNTSVLTTLIAKASNNLHTEVLSEGNVVAAFPTCDDEIYQINDNQYLLEVEVNTYLGVDKIDIDINNLTAIEIERLPKEVLDDIQEMYTKQKGLGNENYSAYVFAPSILANTSDIMPTSDEPLGYTYYTYGNYNLRDYATKHTTPYVRAENNGSNTKALASAFINVGITVAGAVTELPMFTLAGIAVSALDAYEAAFGSVSYGSSSDYGMTDITYHKVHKTTYVMHNNLWYAGCASEKIWLNSQATYQLYASRSGERHYSEKYLNQVFYTSNFKSPAARAVAYYLRNGWTDDPVSTKLWNTTCYY